MINVLAQGEAIDVLLPPPRSPLGPPLGFYVFLAPPPFPPKMYKDNQLYFTFADIRHHVRLWRR